LEHCDANGTHLEAIQIGIEFSIVWEAMWDYVGRHLGRLGDTFRGFGVILRMLRNFSDFDFEMFFEREKGAESKELGQRRRAARVIDRWCSKLLPAIPSL